MEQLKLIGKIFILFSLLSCGKTKVEIPNTKHTAYVGGEIYNYVIVRLEFLRDIERLCGDLYLYEDFESPELYDQAVAQCTFDKISLLDLKKITEFNDTFCYESDGNFTEEQLQNIEEACNLIN